MMRLIFAGVGIAAVVMAIVVAPDVRRYLRMRAM